MRHDEARAILIQLFIAIIFSAYLLYVAMAMAGEL